MIRLVALDLDGTLLNSTGKITGRNRAAIAAAEEKGVLITIATGRRFRDARPVGLGLKLNAPLITHNGALLKYAETLETTAASLLNETAATEIIRAGREFGGDALLSADPHGMGTLYYERISDENLPLQKYLVWSRSLHGTEPGEAVRHVSDLMQIVDNVEVIHISFSGTCGRMSELSDFLMGELGETATILSTIYPDLDFTLIDILPAGASKGAGLAEFAAARGILREEIMAIGDNFNDLEMLEFAGVPVVMGNAAPSLLERPEFYKTVSNNESGVAAAFDRFINTGDILRGE